MHRALSCSDILDDIFTWLAPALASDTLWSTAAGHTARTTPELCDARNNLVPVVCVCKAFHGPAVRILWRKLDGVFPAFKLLPGFVEEWDTIEGHNGYRFFWRKIWNFPELGEVSASDWDRFYKYTTSVQIIGRPLQSSHASPQCMNGKTWSSLPELFQGRHPFPYLRTLSWKADEFGLIMLPLLLSPCLEDITIYQGNETDSTFENMPVWTRNVDALLQELCKRTPQLTTLTFYACHPTRACEVLAALRVPQPNLRSLSLLCALPEGSDRIHVRWADLEGLSRFPLLEGLVIRGMLFQAGDSMYSQGQPINLPNLRELTLESTSNAHLALKHLCAPTLRALHVDNLFVMDSTIEWSSMSWLPSLPTLEVLNFKFSLIFADSLTPIATLFASISTFPRLRSLSIHCRSSRNVSVGDDDLLAVSQALPALETLSVRIRLLPLSGDSHSISTLGLLALLRNCPRLRELELPMLQVRTEDLAHIPDEPVAHGLRRLWLEEGWTSELHCLIRDRLCPNLEDMTGTV
ncbi:hypothetical protein GY45DRAFT_703462 [Cubamyces sp. BRFM 1775]|nr:hypothetical protein GY45DRAFT_703462 [Cubamyces sp. BRFM 1775]